MKMQDAFKTITATKGLPNGDTFIEIDSTEASEIEFKDNQGKSVMKWSIKFEGNEFVIPSNLMKDIKGLHEAGANRIRITRTGEKINTRYAVVRV